MEGCCIYQPFVGDRWFLFFIIVFQAYFTLGEGRVYWFFKNFFILLGKSILHVSKRTTIRLTSIHLQNSHSNSNSTTTLTNLEILAYERSGFKVCLLFCFDFFLRSIHKIEHSSLGSTIRLGKSVTGGHFPAGVERYYSRCTRDSQRIFSPQGLRLRAIYEVIVLKRGNKKRPR